MVGQAWSLAQLASELGINAKTVRDRLDRCGLRRSRHTPGTARRQPAGGGAQPGAGQARRAARLAQLGFADLRVRRLQQGWPIRRLRAELGWTGPGSGSR